MRDVRVEYRDTRGDDALGRMADVVEKDIRTHGVPVTATGVKGLRLWVDSLSVKWISVVVDTEDDSNGSHGIVSLVCDGICFLKIKEYE